MAKNVKVLSDISQFVTVGSKVRCVRIVLSPLNISSNVQTQLSIGVTRFTIVVTV